MTRIDRVAPDVSRPESARTGERFRSALIRAQRKAPLLQIALLGVVLLVGVLTLRGFGTWPSLRAVLVLAALVGFAALGQTIVVLLGGFDLSVAGIMVASAITVTQLGPLYGWPFEVSLLVVIVVTAVLGAIVGWICHRFSIQPLIVTFAAGAIALGIAQVQTGGRFSGGAPSWLTNISSPGGTTFGLPVPPILLIWVVFGVAAAIVLHRTPVGRRLYATGANRIAADSSLIPTRRVWMAGFAFSAVAAGIAGMFLAGFAGNVDANIGSPYLFQSLAAVIVGGTVFGGPGDYTRTIVGALLLTFLTTIAIGHGLSRGDEQIFYGVIIVAAMAVYGRDSRLRDRI